MIDPGGVKRVLYARAAARREELALAASALYGRPPAPEEWSDFLDAFVIEWVDAEGRTEVERAVAEGAIPGEALRWPREVRTALWVVDGWEGDAVLLRDVATEEEVAVHAPGLAADLPRRTVLRARVVPVGERLVFSGEPDVYEPMGVIARLDLLRAWRDTPEPGALERLRALREGFARQREERAAFVAHFGADAVVFADAREMERRVAAFVSHLLNTHRFGSLGDRTRAEAFREAKGEEPKVVQIQLGPTLTGPGRHGVVYDDVEGVHFLPRLGDGWAHLRGEAEFPDVVRAWLDDPGVTALPFRRAGATAALARFLGVPDAPLDELLAPRKDLSRRASPSVLPGFED
ncbi:MAG: hypothetical protein ACOZNI_27605 [Myxococcota bacterium]